MQVRARMSPTLNESIAKLENLQATITDARAQARDLREKITRARRRSSCRKLQAHVLRLLSERPHTTAELIEATGERASRVSGVLIAIQRSGLPVFDLAGENEQKRRWFAIPAHAKDVRLAPKAPKNQK